MNKFTARGIIQTAVNGEHIIVICYHPRAVREALNCIADNLGADSLTATIRLGNGNEHISFEWRGDIRFIPQRQAAEHLRGTTADYLYIDNGCGHVPDALHYCQATGAELIEAE